MDRYVKIVVGDTETYLEYVVNDHPLVSHTHPIGLKHIESEGMKQSAGSSFLEGLVYLLEFVSLYDRIPTDFRLITPRHAIWLGNLIEKTSYAQFFTNGMPVRVTLLDTYDPSLPYARHSQTIFSFKV